MRGTLGGRGAQDPRSAPPDCAASASRSTAPIRLEAHRDARTILHVVSIAHSAPACWPAPGPGREHGADLLTARPWPQRPAGAARAAIEGITQSLQDGTFQVRVRALESADDRRWLDSILGEVTATIVGVALGGDGLLPRRVRRRAGDHRGRASLLVPRQRARPRRNAPALRSLAGLSAGGTRALNARRATPRPALRTSVEGWLSIAISATADLKVSEITYGNWVTHGSQVGDADGDRDRARGTGCRHHDVRHRRRVREHRRRGRARQGPRGAASRRPSRSSRRSTGRSGRRDRTTAASAASTSSTASTGRSRASAPTTSTSTRRTATTTRPRSKRRCRRSRTSCARARRSTSASRSGPPSSCAKATRSRSELGFQLISNQPQYSALWRVIEEKVVPTSEELGISQIVWSPMAQGVLSGKYLPGQPVPEGSRATDEKSGANFIQRFLRDDVLEAVQRLKPDRRRGRPHDAAARDRVGAAEPERVGRAGRGIPSGADRVERRRVRREARRRHDGRDRHGARRRRRARPREDLRGLAEDPPRSEASTCP